MGKGKCQVDHVFVTYDLKQMIEAAYFTSYSTRGYSQKIIDNYFSAFFCITCYRTTLEYIEKY